MNIIKKVDVSNVAQAIVSVGLLLAGLVLLPSTAQAVCAVHDHNCFHGSEPFNPSLDDIQTGTGNLTITSTYQGEADINLHVGLPDTVDINGIPIYGPFVASNPDGSPITGSPLGTDPNILFHNQQTIQWANASALANLTSDTQAASPPPGAVLTRQEEAIISGNVPSGLYDFALHSYDGRNVPDGATVNTVASAGQDGYFLDEGARSAAQLAAGHNPVENSSGATIQLNYSHTLNNPGDVSAIETFNYQYPGFNEHANGVYVIPDGVWNMHGVDPQQLYQFGSADMSQGFVLNQGYQFEANPFDLQRTDMYGYPGGLYDANSGVYFQLGYEDGTEDGKGGNRLNRVVINDHEFSTLQNALYTPISIMQHEGLGSLTSDNRGVVKGFRTRSYNSARSLINCSECTDSRLVEIEAQISSGANTYGLSESEQRDFRRHVIRGYSAAGFYRDLKDDYRKNQAGSYVSAVVNAVLAVYGIPVSIQLGYQSDTLIGPQNVVIPDDCFELPCNGRSQNDLAASLGVARFGGNDILRVDSNNGTVQVNDGEIKEASVFDLANDGKEDAVELQDVIDGGRIVGAGFGAPLPGNVGTLGVNVTHGPSGTSFGASASFNVPGPIAPSVGFSCQGGDCTGSAGASISTDSTAGGLFATASINVNTDGDVGGSVGIGLESTEDRIGGVVTADQDGNVGVAFTERLESDDSSTTTATNTDNDDTANNQTAVNAQTTTASETTTTTQPTTSGQASTPDPNRVMEEIVAIGRRPESSNSAQVPLMLLQAQSNAQSQNSGNSDNNTGCPCNTSTGNKYQSEVDFASGRLSIRRSYNSMGQSDEGFGNGWSSNLARALEYYPDNEVLLVVRPDGKKDPWQRTADGWQGEADSELSLREDALGYYVTDQQGTVEHYAKEFQLLSITTATGAVTRYDYDQQTRVQRVTEPNGLSLSIAYDASNHISRITLPNGQEYGYRYDSLNNLVAVVYPAVASSKPSERRYHYDNILWPSHLTGITDENGHLFKQISYSEDGKVASSGLVATSNAVPQQRTQFDYKDTGATSSKTTMTNANGHKKTLTFERVWGENKLVSKTDADGSGVRYQYDERGNKVLETDAEGRQTAFIYNEHNQLTEKTEQPGGLLQRRTAYTYVDDNNGLVSQISQPSVLNNKLKTTQLRYNKQQQITGIEQSGFTPDGDPVSRAVELGYDTKGRLRRIDGARTDVKDITRLDYYGCGKVATCNQIKRITNALGHTIDYLSYDALGRVTRTQDANGRITDYQYHPRGWLTQKTHSLATGEQRQTHYQYDQVGQLIQQTFADGISLTMSYDAAHALRSVTDSLGNRVSYDYDANGNRIATTLTNADKQTEHHTLNHYDIRDRLKAVEQGDSLTQMLHDATGQLRTVTDPNQNPDTRLSYDALGRLQNTVDALSQSTEYQYNLADKVIAVQSPNGATTRYQYDDLGNQLIEVSPDRGIIEYHYNAAGSVVQSRDARNIRIDYRYDALNRLTAVVYPEADLKADSEKKNSTVSYQYDKGKGCLIGALCAATVDNNATTYHYNGWGNITQQRDRIAGITNTTHYRYDTGNRVIGMTYPDGAQLRYERDALGRITSVHHNDAVVVSNRTYRADGQFTEQTLANNVTEQRDYDQQGRLSAQRFSGASNLEDIHYTHDANGNVLSRATQRYGYDALNRLVNDNTNQYGYDANSNRLSKAIDSATQTLDYFSHSNQLFSHNNVELEYDAVGNQLNDQNGRRLEYNQAGQLVKVSQYNTTIAEYHYNAFNQRVMKQTQEGTTRFTYDLQGMMIQESTRSNKPAGQHNTRIVWLDNQPIQQVANNTRTAIISDHLNTPRIGLDQNANTTWRWLSDGFGHTEPANDPDGNGIATNIKLRFPGQYADKETGLYYNWHRYYDPATGRYITSDPIGLMAGVNTYGYVGGNPVGFSDPYGLIVTVVSRPLNMPGGGVGSHTVTVIESAGVTTTLSSHNIDGVNLLQVNHPSDLNLPQNSENSVVIPVPNGITQEQFDAAVLQQGVTIANNQTSAYSYSPLSFGSGTNCHNTTSCLIDGAGGEIPGTYNPPGLNPGLGEVLCPE